MHSTGFGRFDEIPRDGRQPCSLSYLDPGEAIARQGTFTTEVQMSDRDRFRARVWWCVILGTAAFWVGVAYAVYLVL